MRIINNQDIINLNNWCRDHEIELIELVETVQDDILGSLASDIIETSIQIDSYGICSSVPIPLCAIQPVLKGKIKQYEFWKAKLSEQNKTN